MWAAVVAIANMGLMHDPSAVRVGGDGLLLPSGRPGRAGLEGVAPSKGGGRAVTGAGGQVGVATGVVRSVLTSSRLSPRGRTSCAAARGAVRVGSVLKNSDNRPSGRAVEAVVVLNMAVQPDVAVDGLDVGVGKLGVAVDRLEFGPDVGADEPGLGCGMVTMTKKRVPLEGKHQRCAPTKRVRSSLARA